MQENEQKKSAAEREEEILLFWQERGIFEKSLEQRKGAEEFVFYDGPPFATGLPHYGHLEQSFVKDVVPRYQTMRGKYVPRRWGWDCHGLPLENLIEKELGLLHKNDIEVYGIAKFNKAAENAVLRYADDWKRIIPRMGRWVDMEHDYRTMDSTYTESVWWVFKTLHDKGLIEEGYKSMHLCPRCETTLANFEVSQGYKDIKDISIIVKFPISNFSLKGGSVSGEQFPNTFILAWTTTPWTLPGNVALAINLKITYVAIKKYHLREGIKEVREGEDYPTTKGSFEFYILAKDRLSELEGEFEIVKEFSGSELVEKAYEPLFNYYTSDESLKNRENGWKIYAADFVTTNEGTGIVHIAPAFGEEDMALGKKENLPFVQHVAVDGTFKPEVADFAGFPVKPKEHHQSTDIEIIKYLDAKGLLFKKQTITHSYPHCWRCETPLLNYAASSWFVMITKIRDKLIAANKKIRWTPSHLKEGRFGKGLETAPDWAISRTRYWGAPLPVWRCVNCKKVRVVGSLSELEENRVHAANAFFLMRHGERDDVSREVAHEYARQDEIIIHSRADADVHVTSDGKKELERTAEELKNKGVSFAAIYSSPYLRTQETAAIFSRVFGVPVTTDERIGELNHGVVFEGLTVREYRTFFATPLERFTKAPEGGESLNDVTRRMMNFVREVDKAHEGKNILVISHGDPLWVLEGVLGNKTKGEIWEDRIQRYIRQGEVRECVLSNYPYDEEGRLNLHRPYIDEIILRCDCNGSMKRIPEVFDCWFESGSMPYGQYHYMGKPMPGFDPENGVGLPADFIAEALDQTRGWFYSLHVLATALFEKPAYTHVLATGLVLAEDGQKMSKHLKNYSDPLEIVGKYGADALRLYFLLSSAAYAEDMNFSEKGVDEVSKKVIVRLSNVYSFYHLYGTHETTSPRFDENAHPLDKFICSELLKTAQTMERAMELCRLDKATRALADFADIFSTVYLQYSRDRFKEEADGHQDALRYFRYVLVEFTKIMAPFAPFLAEHLYDMVTHGDAKESVHLEDWPKFPADISGYKNAHQQMSKVRSAIEAILAARSKAGISVRQPLSLATVRELPSGEEFQAIIRERVNIEKLLEDTDLPLEEPAVVDMLITEELRERGMLREFIRSVQEARKEENLVPGDRITLSVETNEVERALVKKFEKEIKKAVAADSITVTPKSAQGRTIRLEKVL